MRTHTGTRHALAALWQRLSGACDHICLWKAACLMDSVHSWGGRKKLLSCKKKKKLSPTATTRRAHDGSVAARTLTLETNQNPLKPTWRPIHYNGATVKRLQVRCCSIKHGLWCHFLPRLCDWHDPSANQNYFFRWNSRIKLTIERFALTSCVAVAVHSRLLIRRFVLQPKENKKFWGQMGFLAAVPQVATGG